MKKLRQLKVNRGLMCTGLGLIGLSLLMPLLFTVNSFHVYEEMHRAISSWEKVYLMGAALRLVALNTLRSFPHYLGAFFVAESIQQPRSEYRWVIHAGVIIFLVPSVYMLIEKIYGIHYDFGVPAVLMIAMLIVLGKINFTFVNLAKKALMVAMLVISFQFLDVMPRLPSTVFGRGEISNAIKQAAELLDADVVLQQMCLSLILLFMFITVLLTKLIADENNLQLANEEREKKEKELMVTKMRVMESRTYMELQHLVHDLKSPLTSMQALVGVVRLDCQNDGREMDARYLGRIEGSIDQMSGMITEILNANYRTELTAQQVTDALLAQISITEYAALVSADCSCPELTIEVNRIRMLRALINLIENSFYAIRHTDGKICFLVDQVDRDGAVYVRFTVADNGMGIAREQLQQIWQRGFTSHQSYGLGLSFVKQVVTENDGTVELQSEKGVGTTAVIELPAVKREETEV